jgi:hypothetical protein
MNLPLAATQSVSVYLKSEDNGEVLDVADDPPGAWQRAKPTVPEDSLAVLAAVAPYADTVFDFRSCAELVIEIGALRPNASGSDAEFFDKVAALAKRVIANHDLFLLFVGD